MPAFYTPKYFDIGVPICVGDSTVFQAIIQHRWGAADVFQNLQIK